MSTRAAVIAAAGASRRMGRDKALLPLDPNATASPTFLDRALELARADVSEAKIVVVRRRDSPTVPGSAATAINPNPDRGMFSSLRIGLQKSRQDGRPEWTLLILVDHPLVQRSTVAALWQACNGCEGDALIPVYAGRRGHPIILSDRAATRILMADPGARLDRLLDPLSLTLVRVGDPGVVRNLNTPARYRTFIGRFTKADSEP